MAVPRPEKVTLDKRMKSINARSYDSLLTLSEEELRMHTDKYISDYNKYKREFEANTKLNDTDMTIVAIGGVLQCLRWAVANVLDEKYHRFENGNTQSHKCGEQWVEDWSEQFPEWEDIFKDHAVPYDATTPSARFKALYPGLNTHIAGPTHRVRAIGHDPLLGLIFGTANIMTSTLTVNEGLSLSNITSGNILPSYKVLHYKKNRYARQGKDSFVHYSQIDSKTSLPQIMKWTYNIAFEKPEVLRAAIAKQVIHSLTDLRTIQGLPVPFLSTFSPELSQYLIKRNIDFLNTSKFMTNMTVSIFIDQITCILHRMYFNPHIDDAKIYDAKSQKVLLYSNLISSTTNIAYSILKTGGTSVDLKSLDVAGIVKSLWMAITTPYKLYKLKHEFIRQCIEGQLKKEEDEVAQKLAELGYDF